MTTDTAPRLFRIIVPVADTEEATRFYSHLLGLEGRGVGGGRVYFDCGSVTLALLGGQTSRLPEYLYLAVPDLEAVHARAQELGCLSTADVHGESAGEIRVRPWRERSFYAFDPDGNGLCFVDETTVFTGR